MRSPKGIEKLIIQRENLAWRLLEADSKLSEWLEKHDVDVNSDDYRGGCMMYGEPSVAADQMRDAIQNKS